jgi:hypothetical protein
LCIAEPQDRVVSKAGSTVRFKVQDCPPKVKENVAVPLEVGVPDIESETEPEPETNVPADSTAVKPETPVEEMV